MSTLHRRPGHGLLLAPAGDDTVRWCGDCASELLFERVPCPDGHGEDCPDLVCTGCGGVVVVGPAALLDDDVVLAVSAA